MTNPNVKTLALLGAACLYQTAALAQTAPTTATVFQQPATTEMIVSANRFAQPDTELLHAHSIISRDSLRLHGDTSLLQALSRTPGVQLARTGNDGAQTSLFMRGSNSNHTLVLLDGVRLNTASEGFARLEHIPVEQIERIEVVRGPQSSLYGADAIGGVVQIFTRAPHAPETADTRSDASIVAGAGTENTRKLGGQFTLANQATRLDVQLNQLRSDGIAPRNAPASSMNKAPYRSDTASARIEQQLTAALQGWASFNGSNSNKHYDGGYSESQSRSTAVGLGWQVQQSWQSNLQVSRFKDNNDTYAFADSRSMTRRDSLQWQNTLTLSNNATAVLGVDVDDESLLYINPGAVQNTQDRDNRGAFVIYQQPFGNWHSSLSLRHDDNQQFGGHTTGRIALGYDTSENSRIWMAAGTAFKAPTLVDLYVDFPDFWFYANPDLQPERAQQLELGWQGTALQTDWQVNAFHSRIRDLIGSDASFSSLTNIEQARINGLEISLQRELFGWQASAAVTLLDHKNRASGERLLRRADEQLQASLSRRFDALTVVFDWQVVGDRADLDPVTFARSRVGGYAVLDAAINWQVSRSLQGQLRVGNVLDKNYELVDGYNTLGRHAAVTLRQQL